MKSFFCVESTHRIKTIDCMWNVQRMSFYVENLHQYNNFFGRVLSCMPVNGSHPWPFSKGTIKKTFISLSPTFLPINHLGTKYWANLARSCHLEVGRQPGSCGSTGKQLVAKLTMSHLGRSVQHSLGSSCGLHYYCYAKRSQMSWAIVIPKEGWADTDFLEFLKKKILGIFFLFIYFRKVGVIPKEGRAGTSFLGWTSTQDIRDLFAKHSPCVVLSSLSAKLNIWCVWFHCTSTISAYE